MSAARSRAGSSGQGTMCGRWARTWRPFATRPVDEIVILAVPFGALDDVVKTAGEALAGKTVIDVTNALDASMTLALGFTTSGAEELQKKLPHSTVVKAFNTVFAQHMDSGRLGDQRLTAFIAGDDAAAKHTVLDLARDIGFDAADAKLAEVKAAGSGKWAVFQGAVESAWLELANAFTKLAN